MKKWLFKGAGRTGDTFGFFQVFIFLLSIYVLIALVADAFIDFDPEVKALMQRIDNGVCLIFLFEFLWRFFHAPKKWEFMKWGWIDLISSIPVWNGLQWGRSIRLLRILRMIRAFRSLKALEKHLFHDFRRGVFASVGIGMLFLVLFCSIGVLNFERDTPGANIHTGGDALWWAMTTITTIGYGDKVPVSGEGRLIGIVLMVGGVSMFSVLTALIASHFVAMAQGEAKPVEQMERIERKLDELCDEIRILKARTSEERLPEETAGLL